MGKANRKKTAKKKKLTRAEQSDIHHLYEESVQCVEAEIDFVDQTYRELRGREAASLREDFCGTMNTSCEWIRRRKDNIAWCVDIDPEVLAWGENHHIANLTRVQRSRIHIIQGDVTRVGTPPVDIVLAMNFSYWIFKDRKTMVRYFRHICKNLKDDGIFFLDCFGGYEAFREMTESTEFKDFTYVWDQHRYNPVTGEGLFHIHFRFKDGSRIRKAFTYDWRVWTLPELTEMLTDAGFSPSVYWEGTDKNGESNGVFTRTCRGEADAGWIAYIVAEK